ncbi:MAG: HEAT repeat domain-containing protein [Chloroflexota bacterium]
MNNLLTRFFSIRPGEYRKTLLLYSLYFVIFLGQSWGALAGISLFLNNWPAEDLSLMFIGNAILMFSTALVYTFFADRISNQRLLLGILGLTALWLLSVRILLETHGGPNGLVYPYFYLGYDIVRDLSTLHLLTYISDFYDTRSAKRTLPFIVSAGLAANTIAGFSMTIISPVAVPVLWIVSLGVAGGILYVMRVWLAQDFRQINAARQMQQEAEEKSDGLWQNLMGGFRFARESALVRWLALSAFAMTVLMNLLIFQSSLIIKDFFDGNPDGLGQFYGLFAGFSNIFGLSFQSLFLGRLIANLGIGTMIFVFPLLTLLSISLINVVPAFGRMAGMSMATVARANHITFKKVFSGTLDTMLYNSMPLQVKGRARGFVNGLVVPIGVLVAGLFLVLARQGMISSITVTIVGVVVGLVYVLSTYQVRDAYRHSLAQLLVDDELAIFRLDQGNFEEMDPAAVSVVEQRLSDSEDDALTIFLAEMLYEMRGSEVIPLLQRVAQDHSPEVRASIIRMIGDDWITDPKIRELCMMSLDESDVAVRRAAVTALATSPNLIQDETLLDAFLKLLEDQDELIQASVIPPLIASGDFYYLAPAVSTLSHWLEDVEDSQKRAMALGVLVNTGDERLVRTLVRHLDDTSPLVRREAVSLIDDLVAQSPLTEVKQFGLETLQGLLHDQDEAVRLAAVTGLARFQSTESSQALMTALNDQSFNVRQQASKMMFPILTEQLSQSLGQADRYMAESAAYILATVDEHKVRHDINTLQESLLRGIYQLNMERWVLGSIQSPSGKLLDLTLKEQVDLLLDRFFWLVSAAQDHREVKAVQRSLQSQDPRTKANAVETLETITSPTLASLVSPLYDNQSLADLAQLGQDRFGILVETQWKVFCTLWTQLEKVDEQEAQSDGKEVYIIKTGESLRDLSPDLERDYWIVALTLNMLLDTRNTALDVETGFSLKNKRVQQALEITANNHPVDLVRDVALTALAHHRGENIARYQAGSEMEKDTMLTIIEKVIFLKEVPFFQGMTIDQLRILASISEEVTCEENDEIFIEGERGNALYVIIKGRVGIQRRTNRRKRTLVTRLATLKTREYFAEMSIFDDEPYSADAIALEKVHLLLIRREPLVILIKDQPDLALTLFQVLSQRLREMNDLLSEKTESRAEQMQNVYDKLF